MANKLKSKKKPLPDPVDLRPEKEEKVEVRSVLRDERTHKISGALLLLLSVFLFIAFTSYLFTWQEDQDKVFQGTSRFLFGDDIRVANLLGRLGAWVSHFFFFKGFGLASFFLCSIFFMAGANLLFGKKVFRLWRNLRYVLVGLLYFSVAFAFFSGKSAFPWGGAVGNMISEWMSSFLGKIGTGALLLLGGVAYFIWRFNPVFEVPKMPALPVRNKERNPEPVPDPTVDDADEPKLFIEETPRNKRNNLKKETGPVVPPPEIISPESIPLQMIEREDFQEPENTIPPFAEPEVPVIVPVQEVPLPPLKPAIPQADLELEIKEVTPEETPDGEVHEDLPPYEPTLDLRDYRFPSMDLLETHGSEKIVQDPAELEANKNQIINTLKNYDIQIQKIFATVGPTVTLYEIVPAAGVRISRIKNLEDDIALSLAALGIRIIAPIPGKGTIGIEVPNVKKTVVSMKTLLTADKFQHSNFSLPIAIGKKIDNENFIVDLAAMPHLLMAGATGQGKSVGLNAILVSLLYKKHPSQLKFVLVDPKKVELSIYRTIEKHFLAKLPGEEEAIITDTKKVVHTLNALCIEMDNRYDLLKEAGTRNIREYNEKFVKRRLNPQKGHQFLPFMVLVIDEFADLIMTAGKEVEMPIARLAQLARAVGIHLIIATQRPSVNIITGTIKANFPARIAFKVSSKIDSRTILDAGGAEQLIGKGDMLISYNGELTRLQCAFVDTPEVESVTDFIGRQRGYPQAFLLPEYVDEKEMEGKDFDLNDKDPLFGDAARLIVQNQIGSTSLLQRRMKLGYNRAGRLMDQLEQAGVVGPNLGSKAREVIIKTEAELDEYLTQIP
ncbi:DNA translocase FtsK 4TM domain-containing protein [Flavihumibacter petaseus]|uniref:DNA translocase FtsK n=1 Tax=Flavihumibacter petaseus NBRC 106054 TaxID=1220578 RepID=A0A0E9N6I5_9BACT|nr:DNA translocase FtsK 4TM domain-containing protein [Flavihumibacter petaseus]GAO45557.1 DNA translocase FtsK [Flavihumibacter petaseus NBRC 106054]